MDPHAWYALPVGFDVAGRVIPKATCHADPRLPNHELANFTAHRVTSLIDHIGIHARNRGVEPARHHRADRDAADDTPACFGTARIIDDRAASLAHLIEIPSPRTGVPGLPRRAKDPQ